MAEKSDAERREDLRRTGEKHADRQETERLAREERERKGGDSK